MYGAISVISIRETPNAMAMRHKNWRHCLNAYCWPPLKRTILCWIAFAGAVSPLPLPNSWHVAGLPVMQVLWLFNKHSSVCWHAKIADHSLYSTLTVKLDLHKRE